MFLLQFLDHFGNQRQKSQEYAQVLKAFFLCLPEVLYHDFDICLEFENNALNELELVLWIIWIFPNETNIILKDPNNLNEFLFQMS